MYGTSTVDRHQSHRTSRPGESPVNRISHPHSGPPDDPSTPPAPPLRAPGHAPHLPSTTTSRGRLLSYDLNAEAFDVLEETGIRSPLRLGARGRSRFDTCMQERLAA